MKSKSATTFSLILSLAVASTLASLTHANEISRMNKEDLRGILGNPNVVIIDVRTGRSWDDSTLKIKGAVREAPNEVSSWMDKYPKEKILVFY